MAQRESGQGGDSEATLSVFGWDSELSIVIKGDTEIGKTQEEMSRSESWGVGTKNQVAKVICEY